MTRFDQSWGNVVRVEGIVGDWVRGDYGLGSLMSAVFEYFVV